MFQSISEFFQNMQTAERVVLWVLALAVLIVVAVYVIRKIRSGFSNSTMATSDYLPEFRKMRDAGDLDDEEFKRLKKTISQKSLKEHLDDGNKFDEKLNEELEANLKGKLDEQ